MGTHEDIQKAQLLHGLDKDMPAVIANAEQYVMEGVYNGQVLSFPLKGLSVFAVINYLRTNNEAAYGQNPTLTNEQHRRFYELEWQVESSVGTGGEQMQYYPFGHDTDRYSKWARVI